jgi:hypothetical protein
MYVLFPILVVFAFAILQLAIRSSAMTSKATVAAAIGAQFMR